MRRATSAAGKQGLAPVRRTREVVARGLLAEIEHDFTARRCRRPGTLSRHPIHGLRAVRVAKDPNSVPAVNVAYYSPAHSYLGLQSMMFWGDMSAQHACRLCGAELTRTFVDLGMSPLCESYLPAERLDDSGDLLPAARAPVRDCLLVQLPAYVPGEDIFSDYAYFSSYSDSWVAHAKRYADEMTARLGLTAGSLVTEVASNDGYLLQHFHAAGIPVLGVEPAANVAKAAQAKGIRTVVQLPRPRDRRGDRRRVRAGRPGRREQRLRARPRHPRASRRACGPWSRTPAW